MNISFKKYYEKNKNKFIECKCGNKYNVFTKTRHFMSKQHQIYLRFEKILNVIDGRTDDNINIQNQEITTPNNSPKNNKVSFFDF